MGSSPIGNIPKYENKVAYWRSAIGDTTPYISESKLLDKGIKIMSIFIVTENEISEPHVCKLLKDEMTPFIS